LKEETLDRSLWRIGFGRGYGPVLRQTTEWWHVYTNEQCTEASSIWTTKGPYSAPRD